MRPKALPAREIERTVLPNGVRVITERMPHVRSVSVGRLYRHRVARGGDLTKPASPISSSTWCSRAPRTAPRSRSRGRWIRSAEAWTRSLPRNWSATTSRCWTSIFREAFEIVADLVRNPLFEKHDIEKEKGVILEELKMEADNPGIPDPRNLLQQLLEGPRAGAVDSRHQADHPHLRPRRGGEVLSAVLRAREHPDHRRGQPEAQATCCGWRRTASRI